MNITTDNSYEEIEEAIRAVKFPSPPSKPSILAYGRNPTPADYRAHADAMEAYESALAAKVTARQAAWNEQNRILGIWKEKLRSEYSHLNDATFNACYSKAYDEGHSAGYGEVRNAMWEVVEFAETIIEANK